MHEERRVLVEVPQDLADELTEYGYGLEIPRVRADIPEIMATIWENAAHVSAVVAILQTPQTLAYLRDRIVSRFRSDDHDKALRLSAKGPRGSLELVLDAESDLDEIGRVLGLLLPEED